MGSLGVEVIGNDATSNAVPFQYRQGGVKEEVAAFEISSKVFGEEEENQAKELSVTVRDLAALDAFTDIYSATEFQSDVMALSMKNPGSFISQHVVHLDESLDKERFRAAWNLVSQRNAILRTALIIDDEVLSQAVVANIEWHVVNDTTLDSFLAQDRATVIALGDSLTRYTIVDDPVTSMSSFVWTAHHAAFDRRSLSLLFHDVEQAYYAGNMADLTPRPEFRVFAEQKVKEGWEMFWHDHLADVVPPSFPAGLSTAPDALISRQIQYPQTLPAGITIGTLVKCAWALVLSKYESSSDVVFGMVFPGRQTANFAATMGPTVSTAPVRVNLAADATVQALLENEQRQAQAMAAFEQTGLQRVRSVSNDASIACSFRNLLIVHEPTTDNEKVRSHHFRVEQIGAGHYSFVSHPLTIEFTPENHQVLHVRAVYQSSHTAKEMMSIILEQFEHVLHQMLQLKGETLVGDITCLSPEHESLIQSWNPPLESAVSQTYPDLLHSRSVSVHPDRAAVASWDGNLTYSQLDDLSGRLAVALIARGVGPECYVPICFEKSMWAIVAMLGIMKAGGVVVVVDPEHPVARRQAIVEQLSPKVALASASNASAFVGLVPKTLIVDRNAMRSLPPAPRTGYAHQNLKANDGSIVLFTSGTTGKPKGIVFDHQALVTSLLAHGSFIGFSPDSRVFQFSAYTFDVSISDMFTTLLFGGCVCVPSDRDRLDSLGATMRFFGVNHVHLTPTVASLLEPAEVPDLKLLTISGEPATSQVLESWASRVELINIYGPAEASMCAGLAGVRPDGDPTCVGRGLASSLWVANLDDCRMLAPIGVVGELLIEGPLLARGYLNNPAITAKGFVTNLPWAQRPDRRFYRSGDLAKYAADGSVHILGRIDTQIKIRGQRAETGEIEAQLQRHLPRGSQAVVDLVQINGGSKVLVAFIACSQDGSQEGELQDAVPPDLQSRLQHSLPAYMVPSHFILVESIPLSTSGKTDRKKLREIVSQLSLSELEPSYTTTTEGRPPTGLQECQLQDLWSLILNTPAHLISAEDNFFQLGGDSVAAMRLVALGSKQDIKLTVADIFTKPVLSDMALAITSLVSGPIESEPPAPFSLVNTDGDFAQLAAKECGLAQDKIVDIYPCTQLQQGLMALSAKVPGSYLGQFVLSLPETLDLDRFADAWDRLIQSTPIMRTCIISNSSSGLLQAVLKHDLVQCTRISAPFSEYHEREQKISIGLGDPLMRFSLVKDPETGAAHFLWTAHHASYDAHSLHQILLAVSDLYRDLPILKQVGFNHFIQYMMNSEVQGTNEFWLSQLEDAPVSSFPSLPDSSYNAVSTASIQHKITFSKPKNCPFTVATLLRAAWALLLARYESSEDVVFASVVNGRNHPMPGIETMLAPTFATMPVRIRSARSALVNDYLAEVQQQAVDMIPFEQTGLQTISGLSHEMRERCNLRTLLVVQTAGGLEETLSEMSLGLEKAWEHEDESLTYPLGVECTLGLDDEININIAFDPMVMTQTEASRLASQLEHVLAQISTGSDGAGLRISQLELVRADDLEIIHQWNSQLPEEVSDVLHGRFLRHAQADPTRPAICSSRGVISYAELDHLSTVLASHLQEKGVGAGVGVPVCFEKAPLAVVSMLATLKAGGYFVPMDHSQPESRLRDICALVNPIVILTSPETAIHFQGLDAGSVLTVTDSWLEQLEVSPVTSELGDMSPRSLAYTIFTSGSSGTPKGVGIEHGAICSSIHAHGAPLGFSETTRTIQFASFSFDVAIAEIFTTLSCGGCICLPSDSQRQNDIVGAMQEFGATLAVFTPAIIQGLRLDLVPTLETLIVGGDKMTKTIIETWHDKLRLFNGYGPTEASILATASRVDSADFRPSLIGKTHGCTSWIVEPTDSTRLVPVGTIGELLLQGPILAREYVDDPEKTHAAFVTQPSFLAAPEENREDRFYKTGDLVRYLPDGSLDFIGRKDNQVKIRGQRVEIGEIEARVRAAAGPQVGGIAVEVVTHKDRINAQMVALFLSYPAVDTTDSARVLQPLSLDENLHAELEKLKEHLATVLPTYMVPSIFVPLPRLPYSAAGKVNSRALRSLVNQLTLEELTVYGLVNHTKRAVSNAMEANLQKLWAMTLNLNIEAIGADDSFFQIGGDSIMSTSLAALAYKEGIELSVQDIFKHPTLSAMALAACHCSEDEADLFIKPMSLLPVQTSSDLPRLLEEAAVQCSIGVDQIEDMYPCTTLQDGFMTLSMKEEGYGVAQFTWLLPQDLSLSRFQSAWDIVEGYTPILRTRITQTPTAPAMMQVVVKADSIPAQWKDEEGLDEYLTKDKADFMVLGSRLVRPAIVRNDKDGEKRTYFCLTLHHSIYDGWMLDLVMRHIEKVYKGAEMAVAPAQFNAIIRHLESNEVLASEQYWSEQLRGSLPPTFPDLPSMTYRPTPDQQMVCTMAVPSDGPARGSNITISTKLRAAWALVVSRYSDEDDVTFASTLNGRTLPVPFIDEIVGPTVTTVPVRIKTHTQGKRSVGEFLHTVHDQAIDMMAHEQFGLQNIRRIRPECNAACQFRSLLLIQSPPKSDETSSTAAPLGLEEVASAGAVNFHTYPLTIECTIGKEELHVLAQYDGQVVDERQMRRILNQFAFLFAQLDEAETLMEKLDWMSPHDLEELAIWNPPAPAPTERCVHDLVYERILDQPDAPALCSWEGELTFRELDDLSARLACVLRTRGVHSGVLVPLLFEKSIWGALTMLAVMRAGGANVAMDPAHPGERLRGILDDVQGHMIICDPASAPKAQRLLGSVLVVDRAMLQSLPMPVQPPADHQHGTPSTPAFILFTSGSTGRPKGIIITHSAFSSSIKGHAEVLRYRRGGRNLQFTAYTSDVSIGEIFTSLSVGACVCVPSDYERMNGIAAAMERMCVDWAFFTPSVALLLNPDDVPSLKTLLYGGETATPENITMWADRLYLINSFGPAECSIWTHCNPGCSMTHVGSNIGYSIGCVTWIVNPDDYNKLAPIGTVGELLIEGPNIAQGYLNNPTKTAQAFVENPAWMPKDGRRRRLYRLGDLARYLPDGRVQFIGRRDAQVKLRGQRIEMGEIEYQLRELVQEVKESAVEMVKLSGPHASNMLAAFMSLDIVKDSASLTPEELVATSSEHIKAFREMTRGLDAALALRIPNHMIPTLYIPLLQMPMTASAKMDRKTLKYISSQIPTQDIGRFTLTERERVPVSTETEVELQSLWGLTLGADPNSFSADDSFLGVGGDSLGAMKLVALAGGTGWSLSVRTIFQHPVLRDMALAMQPLGEDDYSVDDPAPFSLLPAEAVPEIKTELAQLCGVDESRISDAYPCTPLQDGMIAISTRDRNTYVGQFVFTLPALVDVSRVKTALNAFYQQHRMMRTRIAWPTSASGMLQVVIEGELQWAHSNSLSEYLDGDIKDIMGLGTPLMRIALIQDPDQGPILVLSAHHSIFDHYSMLMFYESIVAQYDALASPPKLTPTALNAPPGFNRFIKYLQDQDQEAAKEFWRKELEGAPRETFPPMPVGNTPIDSRGHYTQRIHFDLPGEAPPGITVPTVITAALSLAQASYLDTTDIVFGTTISGRGVTVAGIESMPGPTITTMPVRVMFNKADRIIDFLTSIQAKYAQITEFESFGLQNIRRLSPDAKAACDFQNMLFNQTQGDPPPESDFLGFKRLQGTPIAFGMIPLMIETDLSRNNIEIYMAAHPSVFTEAQAIRLMDIVKSLTIQLLEIDPEMEIQTLQLLTPAAREEIMAWNGQSESEKLQTTLNAVSRTIEARMLSNPSAPAIVCQDTTLSYEELDHCSAAVTCLLQAKGVEAGHTVGLCLDDSLTAAVSRLAVLRAGAAFICLPSDEAKGQRDMILERCHPTVLLVSPGTEHLYGDLQDATVLAVTGQMVQENACSSKTSFESASVSDTDTACFILSSGSEEDDMEETELVHVEQGNLFKSLQASSSAVGIDNTTKMLKAATATAYTSLIEVFATWMQGGCICIPASSQERDMTATIVQSGANTAILELCDIVALQPQQLPSLETMVVVGKGCRADIIEAWSNHLRLFTAYGSGATSGFSLVHQISSTNEDENAATTLGLPVDGISAWIVDPDNHEKLVPVGAVGELVIQGSAVTDRFLGSTQHSNNVFIRDLNVDEDSRKSPSIAFKTGDLVRYDAQNRLEFVRQKKSRKVHHGWKATVEDVAREIRSWLLGIASDFAVEAVIHDGETCLAVFVALVRQTVGDDTTVLLPMTSDIRTQLERLESHLSRILPLSAVPSLYIPVAYLPSAAERFALMESESTETFQSWRLSKGDSKTMPVTDEEEKLQSLWAKIFGRAIEDIGTGDNFFDLGGDSIDAMSLAVHSRQSGVAVDVQLIYNYPTLRDMAAVAAQKAIEQEDVDRDVEPFELVPLAQDVGDLIQEAATKCNVDPFSIEDILPCLPSQEILIAANAKTPWATTVQQLMTIPSDMDLNRLCSAWEATVAAHAILRTRIFLTESGSPMQVVLKAVDPVHRAEANLDGYLASDMEKNIEYGTALHRAAIARDDAGKWSFVWTCNHAVYDGWSTELLMARFGRAYEKQESVSDVRVEDMAFKKLIRYIYNQDAEEAAAYWRKHFQGIQEGKLCDQLSSVPGKNYSVNKALEFRAHGERLQNPRIPGATTATLVQAAWGIVTCHWQRTTDIIFRTVLAGRSAPVQGLNTLATPTMTYAPFRVQLDMDATCEDTVIALQDQRNATIPYEETGMQRIRQASPEAEIGCAAAIPFVVFPSRTSVQNQSQSRLQHRSTISTHIIAAPFFLMAYLTDDDAVDIFLNVDSQHTSVQDVEPLIPQFQYVLEQLCNPDPEKSMRQVLADMEAASPAIAVSINKHHFEPGQPVVYLMDGATDNDNKASNYIATDHTRFLHS